MDLIALICVWIILGMIVYLILLHKGIADRSIRNNIICTTLCGPVIWIIVAIIHGAFAVATWMDRKEDNTMNKEDGWIIVDFDCWHGCNNPEYSPGCDESCIRIRINKEMNDKFDFSLFEKYMEIPCPRCNKVGAQKRCGWWTADSADDKLIDYDGSTFLPSEVQDYTDQIMLAKVVELTEEIEASKERIRSLKEDIKVIEKTTYTP